MIFVGVLCLAACALAQPSMYAIRSSYDYPYPSYDYPYPYYYPLDAPMVAIAPEKAELAKEVIISGIPEAPEIAPLPLMKSLVMEPAGDDEKAPVILEIIDHKTEEEANSEELKEEELKEEELKEEELKEEEPKEEESKEEEPKEEEPMEVDPQEEDIKEEEIHEEEEKEVEKEEEKPEESDKREPVIVKLKPPQFISNIVHSIPISLPQINFPFIGSIFKPKLEEMPVALPGSAPVDVVRYRVSYLPIMEEPLEILKKK